MTCNSPNQKKNKTKHKPTNSRMDKSNVVQSHNAILYSKENERNTATCNHMDESHGYMSKEGSQTQRTTYCVVQFTERL